MNFGIRSTTIFLIIKLMSSFVMTIFFLFSNLTSTKSKAYQSYISDEKIYWATSPSILGGKICLNVSICIFQDIVI